MVAFRDRQDFFAGVLLILFGALGIGLGSGLATGDATHMGPGYMPKVLSYLMLLLGLILALRSARSGEKTVERWKWRPMTFISAGILSFAFSISRGGLVLSILLVTVLSSFATAGTRWLPSLLLGSFLAGVSVLLFSYLLGLPLRVWPS